MRALLDTLQRTPKLQFAVFDGALRGPAQPCTDQTFAARRALLDASAVPLVVVPGRHDWQDCDARAAGGFDPVERLDFIRQTFFDQPPSLGSQAMHIARQSDLPRFRQYRENLRWEMSGIAFSTLNVPDGNNHYSNAGGRNGEFEDRTLANAFWLRHVGEYAKRHRLKSIIILIDADPNFDRYEKCEYFAWLGFGRHLPRDGYIEFKRTLVALSRGFNGTVALIHGTSRDAAPRVRIDQPLHDDRGKRVANFTRIAIARAGRDPQWLDIRAESARWPMFVVTEHDVANAIHFPAPLVAPDVPDTAALQQGGTGTGTAIGAAGATTGAPDSGTEAASSNGLWMPGGTSDATMPAIGPLQRLPSGPPQRHSTAPASGAPAASATAPDAPSPPFDTPSHPAPSVRTPASLPPSDPASILP
ncbi:hypothetical protein DFQ28_010499 [Apophysomyces sp. BC1034]|nr:hypothetical protein DFQ28_010499 [Apophysomyces sp. BC1034]